MRSPEVELRQGRDWSGGRAQVEVGQETELMGGGRKQSSERRQKAELRRWWLGGRAPVGGREGVLGNGETGG